MAETERRKRTMCWGCQEPLEASAVFCSACHLIQPLCSMSPFAYLGIEPVFDIAAAKLEEAYLAALKALHPDRYVGRTNIEREFAQQHSAAVNQSYRQLKDAYERALVLLKLFYPESSAFPPIDTLALQEIFLLQEQLQSLQSLEEKQLFQKDLEGKLYQCYQEISHAFDQNDAFEAHSQAQRYHYLSTLLEELIESSLKQPPKAFH